MKVRLRRDEGQVLGLALVFLTFVALVLAATLTAAATNLHATQTLTQQRDERYAAEAGILAAAGRIQNDPTRALGTDSPSSPVDCGFHPAPSDFVVNSMRVDVACTPRPGSGATTDPSNPPRYSVLALPALGTANEGVIRANVPNLKLFGPVGSTGACDLPADLLPCDTTPNGDPGYGPVSPTAPAVLPTTTAPCIAGVATFLPGTYNALPSANGCPTWWFKPGEYYFDFTSGPHLWTVYNNTTVVGGLQNPNQWTPGQQPTLPGACRAPGDPFANDGVQFVFGGDSRMQVGATGRVELCAQPGTSQQQVAIYGMTPASGPEQQQNLAQTPTTAVTNSIPPYVPYSTPLGATQADDGSEAQAMIPASGAAAITVSGFPTQDPSLIIERATVSVVHHEDPLMQSLAVNVMDGTTSIGSQPVTVDPACNALIPPRCTTPPLDLTPQFRNDPTLASRLNVTFTATAPPAGGPYSSAVDGVVLDLTVAAAGGYRQLTGCTQLTIGTTIDPQACPLVSTVAGAQLYVQGSVYAPTGGLVVNGQPDDPVRFSRGIIARTVVFQPGNGGASDGVTAGGAFDRSVVLDASVNGKVRLSASVSFDDVQAFLENRLPTITYDSWDVK